MKVKVEENFLTNQGLNQREEWAQYELYIDDKKVFSVGHNTSNPKDNTLFNNFKDCYDIVSLLKTFYEYGKNNVELEFKIK